MIGNPDYHLFYCPVCQWAGAYTGDVTCRMCSRGNRGTITMVQFPDQEAAETVLSLGGHLGLRQLAAGIKEHHVAQRS